MSGSKRKYRKGKVVEHVVVQPGNVSFNRTDLAVGIHSHQGYTLRQASGIGLGLRSGVAGQSQEPCQTGVAQKSMTLGLVEGLFHRFLYIILADYADA